MTAAALAGFVLGFFGSVHCIGMCGPLVLAMPAGEGSRFRIAAGRLIYNLGRVATYVAFGALLGSVGGAVRVPEFQRAVSIAAGAAVILMLVAPRIIRSVAGSFAPFARVTSAVSAGIGRLIRKTSVPALFGLGILNGLLPCGFVYLGIAGALASGSTANGMAFMAGFGFGTIPAMFSVSFIPTLVSAAVRRRLARLLPAFTLLVGALLIVRGLALGIPYVSPKLNAPAVQTEGSCGQ
jgi:sulfite exporter TauE/SafE